MPFDIKKVGEKGRTEVVGALDQYHGNLRQMVLFRFRPLYVMPITFNKVNFIAHQEFYMRLQCVSLSFQYSV